MEQYMTLLNEVKQLKMDPFQHYNQVLHENILLEN
jgi:hypothetical protein